MGISYNYSVATFAIQPIRVELERGADGRILASAGFQE